MQRFNRTLLVRASRVICTLLLCSPCLPPRAHTTAATVVRSRWAARYPQSSKIRGSSLLDKEIILPTAVATPRRRDLLGPVRMQRTSTKLKDSTNDRTYHHVWNVLISEENGEAI